MGNNVALGAQGEDLAAEFLTAAGMTIVDRNWRTRYGEIDLIVRSDDVLVFVEVKTRTGRRMGVPAEAVTLTKQRRIRRLAAVWLAEQSGPWTPVRFDVVSVLIESGAEPVIEHLEAVF
ncbi:YraN family protein [Antrihabitans spumae]|uniref:UPF0102 protein ACHIPV_16355 n=1 Tax=Antrihabitans spumae TaxID=3373370 RepID=A0ABW7K6U6_9NOCA